MSATTLPAMTNNRQDTNCIITMLIIKIDNWTIASNHHINDHSNNMNMPFESGG